MSRKTTVNFYISRHSPKEARKRAKEGSEFFIVDISKIIRDLGYDIDDLSKESEFIINYSIRKKIIQGIYSTKCDGILVCYRNLTSEFLENLENFLLELNEIEYTIHSL